MPRTRTADTEAHCGTHDMAKVSHIVLPVSDVPRSREWYMKQLGFTLERELEEAVGIKDESGLTIFLVKATDPEKK